MRKKTRMMYLLHISIEEYLRIQTMRGQCRKVISSSIVIIDSSSRRYNTIISTHNSITLLKRTYMILVLSKGI